MLRLRVYRCKVPKSPKKSGSLTPEKKQIPEELAFRRASLSERIRNLARVANKREITCDCRTAKKKKFPGAKAASACAPRIWARRERNSRTLPSPVRNGPGTSPPRRRSLTGTPPSSKRKGKKRKHETRAPTRYSVTLSWRDLPLPPREAHQLRLE